MRIARMSAAATAALFAFGGVACGNDAPTVDPTTATGEPTDAPSGPPTGVTGRVIGLDSQFEPTELTADADTESVITFDNQDAGVAHNIAITGTEFGTPIANGPVEQQLTFTLPAGVYPFICEVHPGDMTGTLTVS